MPDDLVSAHAVQPAGRPVVAPHVAPEPVVPELAQARLDRVQTLNRAAVAAILGGEEEVEPVDVAVLEADIEPVEMRMVVLGPPVVADDVAVLARDEPAVAVLEVGREARRRARVAAPAVELRERREAASAQFLKPQPPLELDVRDVVQPL